MSKQCFFVLQKRVAGETLHSLDLESNTCIPDASMSTAPAPQAEASCQAPSC